MIIYTKCPNHLLVREGFKKKQIKMWNFPHVCTDPPSPLKDVGREKTNNDHNFHNTSKFYFFMLLCFYSMFLENI